MSFIYKCLELGVKISKLYIKYPLLFIYLFIATNIFSSKGKKEKPSLAIN